MKEQDMSVARVNWTIQAVLAALLGAFALLAANNDFDALCYIGRSTASQSSDAISIHRSAYEAMSRNSVKLEELTHQSDYRADLFANPYHFAEALPFYSVKALFVISILYLHKLGIGWSYTGHVVSAVAYVAAGLLVAFWISKYVTGPKSTFLWLGIMAVPTMTEAARQFTPDSLSCAFIVLAIWLILERQHYWLGSSVAVLAVWIRPDYLLFAGMLTVALWRIRRLSLGEASALLGLSLGSYTFLVYFSGNYGWLLLFQHDFIGYLAAPGEFVVRLHSVLRAYPHVLLASLPHARFLVAYYALGGFLLISGIKREYKAVLAATLLFGLAHILIFPSWENRFFGPIAVIVSMSLITVLAQRGAAARAVINAAVDFSTSTSARRDLPSYSAEAP
jgi:hypothetical protein